MKFKTLTAKNFGSFEQLEMELGDRGLVCVLGENLDAPKADSNGSGKSLLLDALCWALWGSTIRGSKSAKVVNRHRKKNCVVTVAFEDQGNEYKVVRHQADKEHYKANDLEFFVNGTSDVGSSIAETQASVTEALGFEFSTFRAMMPGAGIRAAEMTDKTIKELLEGILQTEALADAQKLARTELNDIRDACRNADTVIEALQTRIQELERDLALDQQAEESHVTNQKAALERRISAQQGHIVAVAAHLASSRKRVHKEQLGVAARAVWAAQIAAKNETLASLRKEHSTLKYAAEALLARIQHLQAEPDTCSACGQSVDVSHVKAALAKCREELSTLDLDKLSSLAASIADLENANKLITSYMSDPAQAALLLPDFQPDFTELEAQVAASVQEAEDILQTLIQERTKPIQNPFTTRIQDRQTELDKTRATLVDKQAASKDLISQVEPLEFWVEGFSAAGIRSHMLKYVTPVLNERAKHYCDLLTSGEMQIEFETSKLMKSGATKESFNIVVQQANGDDTYAGCSGGEKARADLVIAMTLGDLAAMRVNKSMSFRFIDEAFERVDESGLEAIMTLLHDQKDRYDSVFVVTHKNELKQHFNQTLTVQKADSISTLQ